MRWGRPPHRFVLFLLVALGMLSGTFCGFVDDPDRGYRLAVIPKGTTHEFWKSIQAGAERAAEELTQEGIPVEIFWKGPLKENDREQQIQVVEGFISQGVDGIVLAPLDDRALVRPVEEARLAGIPAVIIDSGLESDQYVSFVATDNYRGGELAAQRLGQRLEGNGKVLLLRYQEGSASTSKREQGFLERLGADFPDLKVISSDQYSGPTRETAKQAAENLLNRFAGQVDAIFCPNESSTAGMLLALQDRALAGKLLFVGFDETPALTAALEKGDLEALVVQNPDKMGYLGVRTMVRHLQGETVEARIDTGVFLLTRENLQEHRQAGSQVRNPR